MALEIVLTSVIAGGLALWVLLDERLHRADPLPHPVEVRHRRVR